MRVPTEVRRMLRLAAIPAFGVLGFFLFRSAPTTRRASTAQPSQAGSWPLALQGLPRLQNLQRAGELPTDGGMRRDLFLFEDARTAPVSKPHVPAPASDEPLPAPDPDRILALASAPRGLRYLGFLRGAPAGLLAAFMAGEEPLTLPPGADRNGWRLVAVAEEAATFRNQRFPDLTFTLHAKGDS